MKTFRYIFILLFVFISLICNAENTFPTNYRDHNKVNTCKNLLQKYTLDELSMMISTGNFDDIYVGDYIEMKMTTNIGTDESPNNVTEKVRWLVAAIDYFRHRTDSEILYHHIVLVAEDCFKTTHRMNSSNTTANGFAGSEMYVTTLPKYDIAITNAFGSSHVLSYHQLLTNSMSSSIPSMAGNNLSGASNNWAWANGGSNPHVTKLCLMSEPQLFKTMSFSSSFYDIGINNSQFPLFAQMPEKIRCGRGFNSVSSARIGFWLSSVVSTAYFALCSYVGSASSDNASYSLGVRPYFLFK